MHSFLSEYVNSEIYMQRGKGQTEKMAAANISENIFHRYETNKKKFKNSWGYLRLSGLKPQSFEEISYASAAPYHLLTKFKAKY